MKNYFKTRKFLCTKKLKMDDGEVSFKKDKVYSIDKKEPPHLDRLDLINESGRSHTISEWIIYFIEIKPVA